MGRRAMNIVLLRAFADSMNVPLVIVAARDRSTLRELLAEGSVDIAAAQLTADESWKRAGLATSTYRDVEQLVVQRRGHGATRNISALNGARVVVRENSPQLQLLRQLRDSGASYLTWTEFPREQADPLDWVSTGDADFAIIDRSEFAFARHLFPEVNIAFSLPDPRPLQWLIRRSAIDLRDAVNSFLAEARDSGQLQRLAHQADAEPANLNIRRLVASKMTSPLDCPNCGRCLNRPRPANHWIGAYLRRSAIRNRTGTITPHRATGPLAL